MVLGAVGLNFYSAHQRGDPPGGRHVKPLQEAIDQACPIGIPAARWIEGRLRFGWGDFDGFMASVDE